MKSVNDPEQQSRNLLGTKGGFSHLVSCYREDKLNKSTLNLKKVGQSNRDLDLLPESNLSCTPVNIRKGRVPLLAVCKNSPFSARVSTAGNNQRRVMYAPIT